MSTDPILSALRHLDAADPHVDAAGPRARADLDAILATAPVTPVGRGADRSAAPAALRRPAARRLVLAGGAVAAVTAAVLVLPSLSGGDRAFATWTAAPEAVGAQEGADAAAACRRSLADGAGADDADRLAASATAIAERRGAWTAVVLAGAEGFSALCISDETAGPFADAMIGSVGTPDGYAVPGPRDAVATDLGTGTVDAGDVSLAAGYVGADVVGVGYRSQGHGTVTATVANGRFALWFPGDELMDASAGVEVELTYRDGTTASAVLTL